MIDRWEREASTRLHWAIALAALATLAVSADPQTEEPPPDGVLSALTECDDRWREAPEDRDTAGCFRRVAGDRQLRALDPRLVERVVARYEGLIERHPDQPWPPFHLAAVEWSRRTPRVPDLYARSAELLAQSGDVMGEVDARRGRARFLALMGRLDAAAEEMDRLTSLSGQLDDPELAAKIRVEHSRFLQRSGGDLEQAFHLLMRDRALIFGADGVAQSLERPWLTEAASVSFELGRYDEAEIYLEGALELTEETGEISAQAATAFRLALVHAAAELPTQATRDEVRRRAEQALALAREAGNLSVEAQAHRLLGQLGTTTGDHLERCRVLAEELAEHGLRSLCLGALAVAEASSVEPAEGRLEVLLDDTLEAARASEDPWSLLMARWHRARVFWRLDDREKGTQEGLALLDEVESLRDAQAGVTGRAHLLGVWWEPYQWLAGQLLDGKDRSGDAEEDGAADRRELEQAFQVVERMRARTLLETSTSTDPDGAVPDDLTRRLAEAEEGLSLVQRRLSAPDLPTDSLNRLLAERSAFERRAADLRHQVAMARLRDEPSTPETFATLAAVEGSLAHDQALLSFQHTVRHDLYGRPAGGSWVTVSTSTGSTVRRLADRLEVAPRLEMLATLEDPERVPNLLVLLYRKLLAPALVGLPEGIERLVIVADGDLHYLPFALLRPTVDPADSLAMRYRLSFAPSATLWLRWRQQEASTSASIPALVLADPLLTTSHGSGGPVAIRGGGPLTHLAPLAHARDEGRDIVGRLAGGSLLRVGSDASEYFLETHDLEPYALVHFAAHARVDPAVVGRSAIFLAPGNPGEDGWLQPHEIADLDLRDRLVVLGACDTTRGELVRGEGLMSLARAFFAAGARTVVGSQRPLPDDEAARLFSVFYRRLAEGERVGDALAAAQRERLVAGASSRGWGSVVVLGDADQTPFPGGFATTDGKWVPGMLVALTFLGLGAFWFRWRATSERSPGSTRASR